MTDHEEEQDQELEALESIYPEELEILTDTRPKSFQIAVKSQLDDNCNVENDEDDDLPFAECMLKFTYTPDYPDTLPQIEVVDPEEHNLDDDDVKRLLDRLKEEGEENVGMAMIFTLVSVALDWLTTNSEEKKQKAKEDRERRIAEAEEAERKRFEGTRVTVETFMAWKLKFDAEMAELKRIEAKRREAAGVTSGVGGQTGKQLFESNADLDVSDIKFLGDDPADSGAKAGGGAVEVDESLFQDLDDLDLDDLDDDDDEDYDPDLDDDDD